MRYLTTNQYKLNKSAARHYKTVGLALSPATEATGINGRTMCAMAGTCAAVCLAKTGMNVFPQSKRARIERTRQWVHNPDEFLDSVVKEIRQEKAKAYKNQMVLAVRPNLLSDQRTLGFQLANRVPDVQFYDYTKLPPTKRAFGRIPLNYHLTYSVSERTTKKNIQDCVDLGVNLAVVFAVRRDETLPHSALVRGKKLRVVDGDKDDLRFLDPQGVVVGLRWKGSKAGMAAAVKGGFAFDPTQPIA